MYLVWLIIMRVCVWLRKEIGFGSSSIPHLKNNIINHNAANHVSLKPVIIAPCHVSGTVCTCRSDPARKANALKRLCDHATGGGFKVVTLTQ